MRQLFPRFVDPIDPVAVYAELLASIPSTRIVGCASAEAEHAPYCCAADSRWRARTAIRCCRPFPQ
jgi:hypothetical protein